MQNIYKILSIFGMLLGVVSVVNYPLYPVLLGIFLLVYARILSRFRYVWLYCLPALLPILDFTNLSGRFFYDEFDIFLLVTLSVKLWYSSGSFELKSKRFFILGSLFAAAMIISTFIGLYPCRAIDLNSFSNYHSPFNSFRIFKGFGWAFIFLPFIIQDMALSKNIKTYFIPGILTGLACSGLFVFWERQIFSGLFNFDSRFRVVGPFSGMHTGGVGIDAYFAGTLPFVISCFIFWKKKVIKVLGMGLFFVSLYAFLVTFSRIVYLAFLLSSAVFFASFLFNNIRKKQVFFFLAGIMVILSIVSIPVLKGSFIQSRFAYTSRDIGIRLEHWKKAVGMMDMNMTTKLFGMGLGSYPRIYAQRGTEYEEPSFYQFVKENNNPFLRLPSFGYLYFEQKIVLKPDTRYLLQFDARSNKAKSRLTIPICEKSLLHSFDCRWLEQTITDHWQTYRITFNSKKIGQGNWLYQKRPVKLSFLNGHRESVVDIDNVQLDDSKGNNLILNGDFSMGIDHWFFTADSHLPWHVKNIWVYLFFESGWVGLICFSALLIWCLTGMIKDISQSDWYSLIGLSSIVGFLSIGVVGSLFDFPRITLLFFMILFSTAGPRETKFK